MLYFCEGRYCVMPAAITHFLHAQRVLKEIEKNNPKFTVVRDAFLWGAQGPDFLYCHRFLPWQKSGSLKGYGSKLHRDKPSKLFAAMREYAEAAGQKEIVRSYLYGFLCHYSLDRTGHPFIRFESSILLEKEPDQNESILHAEIESILDVIILRYELGLLPVEFRLKKTVPKNDRVQAQIADLYAFVLKRLYGLADSNVPLLQATSDCRKAFGLLNDRTTMKKALLEHLEKRSGKRTYSAHIRSISEGDGFDYANIRHSQWSWPRDGGVERNESFLELYEQSVAESVKFIDDFFKASDYGKMTGEIPFYY